jgi:signal transduction histidine kinase/ligand-binding sensor domain-containing protein
MDDPMRFRLLWFAALLALAAVPVRGQVQPDAIASDGTVVVPSPVAGSSLEVLHRNWTTREGLPQDHIRAIERTRDGFLWLATDAGLARFDGFEFKTYGLREGLGAVAVLALMEARDGTLWIGTLGGGISALRDGKITRTYTQADGLPSESVTKIGEDESGSVWVTSDRAGQARLSGERFVPAKGGWMKRDAAAPADLSHVCEDAAGRLWAVQSSQTLWCRDEKGWRKYPTPKLGGFISSLAAGADGTIWITYFRAGVRAFRDGKFLTIATTGEPFDDLAEVVHCTPDGQVWIGTSTRGLFALTPSRLKVVRVEAGEGNQSANFVGALAAAGSNSLLVGTQGRGFYLLRDGVTEEVEVPEALQTNYFVNCMLTRPQGEIWAGGQGGISRFRDGKVEKLSFGDSPNCYELCEDTGGEIWAGFGDGTLYRLKDGKKLREDFGSSLYSVKGIACQADGTLWVGTRGNGLFSRQGGDWKRHGIARGLLSEVVRVIGVGSDDTLWVGTAGGGLAVKRGERFESITTREGLPDDTVSQIMEDAEGRLWLGTNRGLAVISKKDVERIKQGGTTAVFPRVIDRFDGLVSEEFTIVPPVKMDGEKVAFATTNGIALLKTDDFHAEETTPPVVLEEVLLDGRAVGMGAGTIEVPPAVKRIEFRFTGLHFAAPDRLRFRNRLAGLEEEWGSAGTSRSADYRNVEPGEYQFEVSASTGNGLWSVSPAVVKLVVKPNFWQTAWFRVLATAGVLAAVVFAVRRRERLRASRRIQQLERQQAVDNERARIARDLHDDVGASLTQVALLSQLARSSLAKRPERAGQHVQEIFNTAKEVTRSLDEIVWAVNPANDTFESFALFLGAFVQNYSHTAGLRCRIDVPEALPALPLEASVRHHLYLATKEVMHNVAKHAQAGEIRMKLGLERGGFRLVIEDDGRGYDSEAPKAPDADGLINLQNRLKQIGGTCTRRSTPGQGTSVEMAVPVGDAAVK